MKTYRSDIDGLRCIAVLAVLIAHAGGPLSGGHLGVDIFFVISGFLIGGILLREIQNKSFTFLNFYHRRAKRILPAVIVVSFLTVIFGILILPANELKELLLSVISANMFSANIYYWLTQDYFSPDASLVPFLHTWSLGIEEQFYFIYPIILMVLVKINWKAAFIFLLLATTTSLFSGYFVDSQTSFYLLPFRAWELLIGAMCAMWMHHNPTTPKSSVATHLGLALIVVSLIFLGKDANETPILIIFPTIGTGLILLFGDAKTSPKILSTKVFLYFGTISYSLYLVHQPVFAYTNMIWINKPTFVEMLPAFIASITLAHFSWKFVETPFRHSKTKAGPFILRSISVTLASVLCFFMLMNAPQWRESPQELALSDPLREHCHLGPRSNREQTGMHNTQCLLGNETKPDIALIGDSHSATLFTPLKTTAQQNEWSLVMETYSGCMPYFDTKPSDMKEDCKIHNEIQISKLLDIKPRVIVLFPRSRISARTPERLEHLNNSVQALLATGAHIVFVLPVHEPGFNVTPTQWKRSGLNLPTPYALAFDKKHIEFGKAVKNGLPNDERITFIDPTEEFCSETECTIVDRESGISLFYDDDHLSIKGGMILGKNIEPILKEILNDEK